MPENPTVADVLPHVTKATLAQAKLREAMAKVAAELAPKPREQPEEGKSQ